MSKEKELYQNLHNTNSAYQNNNWMMDSVDFINELNLNSILEIGCGNGKFLNKIAETVPKVYGIDLVQSPVLDNYNFDFFQMDILENELPISVDLIVSSDVLEHFYDDDVPKLIEKMSKSSKKQYHIIACYDDGISHQTILSPEEWLTLFYKVSNEFRLAWVRKRKGRDICCIMNF